MFGTEIRKNIEDIDYIFDIFANFGPKFESTSLIFLRISIPNFQGNIQDIKH